MTQNVNADLPVPSGWMQLSHVHLGGSQIVVASRAELADAMAHDCQMAKSSVARVRPRLVFDVNGHGLSLKETDPSYRNAVDRADVLHADGGFLVTLSRWLAQRPIKERSATTDLIHDLAQRAQEDGLSFYLLGGTEEVNRDCVDHLSRLYPNLRMAGRRHGYFSEGQVDEVVSDINATQPDVLWIGLGKPREQIFALDLASRIDAGWIVTCGGCYNYIVGTYKRAPMWMQRANLEWLYRAATNPKNLLWRYLTTSPHALLIVLLRSKWMAKA